VDYGPARQPARNQCRFAGNRRAIHVLESEGREFLIFRQRVGYVQRLGMDQPLLRLSVQFFVHAPRVFVGDQQSAFLGIRSVQSDQEPLAGMESPQLVQRTVQGSFLSPTPLRRALPSSMSHS
jgi:hypothetical protein